MSPESPARPSPLLGAAAAAPLVLLLAYLAFWRLGVPLPDPDPGATLLAVASTAAVAILVWLGLRASLARVEGNDAAVAAAMRAVSEAEHLLRESAQANKASQPQAPGLWTMRSFLLGLSVATLVIGAAWAFTAAPGDDETIHIHAAWALFVDGDRVNFTAPAYDLANTGFLRGHLHVPDQDIIHLEGTPGLTLADFFHGSLDADLWDTGLRLDASHAGAELRNDGNRTLRLFVVHEDGARWLEESSIASYQPLDHDRILLTYGALDDATLQSQADSVAFRFPDF
ncbi:MAG: hypothetical protein WC876_02280 [Candidatus Thermoplasmatota archaeon]|jgi:hypothetical protein